MVKMYFLLDDDGYVTGISSSSMGGKNEVYAALPQDDIILYVHKYVDGEFIKDEERQRQIIEEEEARRNKPSVTDVLMMELLAFKGAYSSVPCQNHTDYPSVIEKFLKGEDI